VQSPPKVLSCRFPTGLWAGYDSVYFIGWEDVALGANTTTSPHYDEIYISFRMRTRDLTYENNAVYTKIFYNTSA
jgi:hypothetical protein